MSYKPKFCNECGENIENADRKFLRFRHFCELCETQHGVHDKMPWFVAAFGVFIGIFGIGNYLQTPANESAPMHLISRNSQNTSKSETNRTNSVESNTNTRIEKPIAKPATENKPIQNLTTQKTETASNSESEAAYFCGAATKKGTPCSRRVKGGGRCWQHEGQAAILPADKLSVSSK